MTDFSVITNPGSFTALQTLTDTNSLLEVTSRRINTGLRVSGTKDDSAIFAIAQNLRADIAEIGAITASLDRATSTLDVAIAGAEAISDLLLRANGFAAQASDAGLGTDSRDAYSRDYGSIIEQITAVAQQATFDGTNIIYSDGGIDNIGALRGFSGTDALTITVTGVDLTSTGLGLTLTGFTTAAEAADALSEIDAAVSIVANQLANFGAKFRQIELQRNFADVLRDTLDVGVGNLVDANLARENATLQALQVRQQLGVTALNIANQQPQTVLSLFN